MIIHQPVLSAETAFRLVSHAMAHARSKDWAVAIAVADPSGAIQASLRMDDVVPVILEVAIDKAYTAATMRCATKVFGAEKAADPVQSLGLSTRQRLVAWGGGLPIVHDGRVVGGIGVSGVRDFEDIEIGHAALAAEGLGWEP
ncbi:heme-binding protein [Mangrovicoccus sp. HB161399]|uniref:GlcG/HbpS family heme-binding protein n=1 Tax=Mangrovicoccus sp. HB161399 TaxID=2720392 RepID=UPI001554A610|nr:heme-binding protein [Mangrovicoccus sp. HB161399]